MPEKREGGGVKVTLVILAIILCAAVSILISTVVTCVVATKIYRGAFDYVEKIMSSQEENRQ